MPHHQPQTISLVTIFIQRIFSLPGLFTINTLFMGIMVFSFADITYTLGNSMDDTERVETILEGLATMFVAYGVALEEREGLMRMIGYYPASLTPRETYLDNISHQYGVLLLIIALITEVIIQIVKIPDRFIDAVSFELLIYGLATVCLVVIGYLLAAFCNKLMQGRERIKD